ncbi:VOC family protein [Ilumatobacter sp.]|uniref:VOC family protein n=1 Tax=Ilumatobacter sp. TaxID=1967498 RepID=UPI003B5280EC
MTAIDTQHALDRTTDEGSPRRPEDLDTGAVPAPDLHPGGVNHLALATCDMKAQLEFWGDVLGCPTKGLFWMHGVEDTFHGFVELSPGCWLSFVQSPANPPEPVWGVSHAGNAASPVTAGAMQHVAVDVGSFDELLTMRDRIRSRGIQVMGPIDHGFCQSIYFAGPENLSLEVCFGEALDESRWIDPEVRDLCGIDAEQMERLKHPAGFTRPDDPVAQPELDESKPSMRYPRPVLDAIMSTPDAEMWDRVENTPPVP